MNNSHWTLWLSLLPEQDGWWIFKPAPAMQPSIPKTESAYEDLVEALDVALDAGGADESHPLASLADYLGDLIEVYEAEHHPVKC